MRKRNRWAWRTGGPFALALVAALAFMITGGWQTAQGQESPLATPVPATPIPAEAAPPPALVPVTLPSISGTIQNSNGEPLAGLIVVAYRRQQANWATARQTTTDAAGQYTFPWMAAGTYRLYIHDPQDVYAATYYPDATDIEEASDVVVTGEPVTALDTQIADGGQITGTLSWPDGPSPINSNIELYYVTAAPITTRLSHPRIHPINRHIACNQPRFCDG